MLTKIKKLNRHFNAYHHDNALLIQFIVVEFIEAHSHITTLNVLIEKISDYSNPPETSLLLKPLQDLLGALSENERFTSSWNKSPLGKLKNYCSQFSKNSNHLNKNAINLYNYVHQTWVCALQNLEALNNLQHTPSAQKILTFKKTHKQLLSRLNYITKQILRILSLFWNNENVMFFLYRKRDELEKIYGEDFLNQVFKTTNKKSSRKQELIRLLMKRYIERGFGHLVSNINFSEK